MRRATRLVELVMNRAEHWMLPGEQRHALYLRTASPCIRYRVGTCSSRWSQSSVGSRAMYPRLPIGSTGPSTAASAGANSPTSAAAAITGPDLGRRGDHRRQLADLVLDHRPRPRPSRRPPAPAWRQLADLGSTSAIRRGDRERTGVPGAGAVTPESFASGFARTGGTRRHRAVFSGSRALGST